MRTNRDKEQNDKKKKSKAGLTVLCSGVFVVVFCVVTLIGYVVEKYNMVRDIEINESEIWINPVLRSKEATSGENNPEAEQSGEEASEKDKRETSKENPTGSDGTVAGSEGETGNENRPSGSDETSEDETGFEHTEVETTDEPPTEPYYRDDSASIDIMRELFLSNKYTLIMIYGVDARNNEKLTKGANADSEIIAVINNETYEVRLVSLLRDVFTETPSGHRGKLTSIYAAYGVAESLGSINRMLDLAITKYVTVNWRAVAEVVNLMGGIDITLTSEEVDYINRYTALIEQVTGFSTTLIENTGDGVYHLDGVQTVRHAANRTVGQHDISRAERQRKVIYALLAKAKTLSLSKLDEIVNVMLPEISTNLQLTEIISMVLHVKDYSIGKTGVFPFKYINQLELSTAYVYCNTLQENVSRLYKLLFDIEDYDPTVEVYRLGDYIDKYGRQHP